MPISDSASIVGSSLSIDDSKGEAPMRSPAPTNTVLAFFARSSATRVAMCSAPPAGTRERGCIIVKPLAGALRLPWKSLMARICTLSGVLGGGAGGGAVAQPTSSAANST